MGRRRGVAFSSFAWGCVFLYNVGMKNFRQWHEDNCFFREDELFFGRCDVQHRLSLSEILLITSDTAVQDYHVRGFTYDVLKENNFAILVSRASFKINKMPMVNDMVTVRTWEEAPAGLQLSRKYEILDKDGQVLISGSSLWIVVNPESRRIVKPDQFTIRELPTTKTEFEGIPCGKISIPENTELLDERVIRYTDLDANGHMNNSRYGSYIMDCLPEDLRSKNMTNFRINYSQEATLGDKLHLFGAFSDSNKFVIVGKTDKVTCFEAELHF